MRIYSSGDENVIEEQAQESDSSEKTVSDHQAGIDMIDLDKIDFIQDVLNEEEKLPSEEHKEKIVLSSSEEEKEIEKDIKESDEELPMEYPT